MQGQELTPFSFLANAHGFSLHAGVRCDAEDRQGIEQLCRYITRPAIANERLSINRDGNVVLKLKTPWRNGTTHIVLTPMEFMQRLAALVPRPRLHLIRFHGVLAPNAKLRSQVVPVPPQRTTAGEGDCTHAHGKPVRTWAQLLKRVFDIDIERCACGGKLKLVAVIEEPAVIDPVAAWGYIAAYAKRAFESPIPASEFHKYMFLKILLFIRYLRRTARHVAMDRGMA